jgi:hypothetical protein
MSGTNKQIYIPKISITGSYVEEIGSQEERLIYPGTPFDITLSAEDFANPEEYHTVWINITRAVKTKLTRHATVKSP